MTIHITHKKYLDDIMKIGLVPPSCLSYVELTNGPDKDKVLTFDIFEKIDEEMKNKILAELVNLIYESKNVCIHQVS